MAGSGKPGTEIGNLSGLTGSLKFSGCNETNGGRVCTAIFTPANSEISRELKIIVDDETHQELLEHMETND